MHKLFMKTIFRPKCSSLDWPCHCFVTILRGPDFLMLQQAMQLVTRDDYMVSLLWPGFRNDVTVRDDVVEQLLMGFLRPGEFFIVTGLGSKIRRRPVVSRFS